MYIVCTVNKRRLLKRQSSCNINETWPFDDIHEFRFICILLSHGAIQCCCRRRSLCYYYYYYFYPAPGSGTGYCFRSISLFLVSLFLCFFVSNITRKRLDRLAWNFQGRCGVTMGRPITFWVNSGKPRDATMLGGGVCCAAHHSFLHLLFVAITYGKVSLWLEKPGKLREFFLLLCGHPEIDGASTDPCLTPNSILMNQE